MPDVKRLEGKAGHSSISFVEDWGCPALHICLRGIHRGDLTSMNVSNSGNFLINLTFVISIFFVGDIFLAVRVSIHSNEGCNSGAQSFVIEVPFFFLLSAIFILHSLYLS